jgi:hypothetical protein
MFQVFAGFFKVYYLTIQEAVTLFCFRKFLLGHQVNRTQFPHFLLLWLWAYFFLPRFYSRLWLFTYEA